MAVLGRQTIRPSVATHLPGNPMVPVDGHENRRTRLWPEFDAKPGSRIARLLQSSYLPGLDAVEKIIDHKADAFKSGRFTQEGLAADALQFAMNNLIVPLKKGRGEVAAAKKELARMRAEVKLQPIDKTDVVGFLQRQEIRAWLKSMPAEQRQNYLSEKIDHLDPTIALAVMEAPADMGIAPDSVRSHIFDRALEAQHGAAVAEFRELELAIEVAESTIEIARDEVRREVGILDPREFDRLAAPIEAKVSAPWLRRQGAEVRVVDLEQRVERKATEEDLATGIFADTHDEYLKEQAA